MAKITVVYDQLGNTLDVWFTKPQKALCEEVGDGIVLKKNKRGQVLGFEKLNFLGRGEKSLSKRDFHFETRVA